MSSSNSIESILEKEGFYMFTGNGTSMWPLIREKEDVLEVRPCVSKLKKYDIALYRSGEIFVAHRVMESCDGYCLMRGDNCYAKEKVNDEDILGTVVTIWRNNKKVNMTSLPYRLYALLIVNCHGPFLTLCKKILR